MSLIDLRAACFCEGDLYFFAVPFARRSLEIFLGSDRFLSSMKNPANLVTRVIAGLLVIAGLYWAFFLVVSVFLVVGLFINMLLIPGWLCFFGWLLLAIGRRLEMPERQFWILSTFAHCWILIVVSMMFPSDANAEISPMSPVFGVLFALCLSVLGAFLCDAEIDQEKSLAEVEGDRSSFESDKIE